MVSDMKKTQIKVMVVTLSILMMGVAVFAQACYWDWSHDVCHVNVPASTSCEATPKCGNIWTCSAGSNEETSYFCNFNESGYGELVSCTQYTWDWMCDDYSFPNTHCLFSDNCGNPEYVTMATGTCVGQDYEYCD